MYEELVSVVGEYNACILLGIDNSIIHNLTIKNEDEKA